MNRKSPFLIAAALACAPQLGRAQLLQERNLPLSLAQDIAQSAVATCAQRGFNVSAAVADRAGVLRALLRADNAGPHTVEASRAKAYTSASARQPTLAMGETAQKTLAPSSSTASQAFCCWAAACRSGPATR